MDDADEIAREVLLNDYDDNNANIFMYLSHSRHPHKRKLDFYLQPWRF